MRVTTPKDLGNLVHDRRAGLNLTQAQLAERAGVSRLWVNQVEAGHGGASLMKVLQLLAALDMVMDVDQKPPSRLAGLRARRAEAR